MASKTYEGMFLLDANRYSRDSAGVTGRVGEMIEKSGGEVLVSRIWAEQKLAYHINGQRKGAYWLVYFKMDGQRLGELRRAAQLNNDVLRDLVLAVDDRLADTLVAHAKSGGKPAEPPKKPAPKAENTETAAAAETKAPAAAGGDAATASE